MKCWTAVLVLLVLACPWVAPVQAAPPSTDVDRSSSSTAAPSPEWERTVAALADALVGDAADTAALAAVLTDHARVRDFAGPDDVSLSTLAAVATEGHLVGRHAYNGSPRTLASDLAEDFQLVEDVPAELKDRMIPSTGAATDKANAVAHEWVATILNTDDREPVGVLVLWHPTLHDGKPGCLFVLVKGTTDGRGIIDVVFGHPLLQ